MVSTRGLFRLIVGVFAVVPLWLAPAAGADEPQEDTSVSMWKDATGDLAGKEFGKGIVKLAAWPGKDMLVAAMADNGLWSSADGGKTWARLGKPGQTPPNKGRGVQFTFDPKNKDAMWCSGMYGFGLWATTDGGATFTQLGGEPHMDGHAVDLSDAKHLTLLHGKHETANSLQRSTDGGKTWQKIGDKIPAGYGFSTDPLIIDAKTFLVNTAGWGNSKPGIWRSEDAGETWAKVSDAAGAGNATVTSKGAILWPVYWDFSSIRSTDGGKTWAKLGGPARSSILELPDGKLAALGVSMKEQVYVSSDEGKTWGPAGEPLPFKADGLVYSEARKSFYAWRQGGREGDPIVCWEPPKDIATAITAKPQWLTAWDGEGVSGGLGWNEPKAPTISIKPTTAEHYNGKQCLEFHAEKAAEVSCGYNWLNWAPGPFADTTMFDTLSFAVKVTGTAKPKDLKVGLASGPDMKPSGTTSLLKYNADALDGKWHKINVPLKDLEALKGYAPYNVFEIRLSASGGGDDSNFSVFLDMVRFNNGATATTKPPAKP